MPARWASARERSWMRRLAPSMTLTRPAAGSPSGRPASNDSTAISDATSPAWAPPIPSATTNRGARTKRLSSLPWRCRPRSDAWKCSAMRSTEIRISPSGHRNPRPATCTRRYLSLEGEFGIPDANAVTNVERLRTPQRLAVEIGPVRGPEVLEDDHVPLGDKSRVGGGGERVLEPDVGALAAAERGALREVVGRARAQAGGVGDAQLGRAGHGVVEAGRGAVHAGRVLVRRRRDPGGPATQVLERRPRHPEQEQVQDGEEAELERHGDRVECHAPYSSSKVTRAVPSSITSPGRSDCGRAGSTRRPLTFTPLVEPRSRTIHEPPDGRISACLRETLGSSTTMSASRERPSTAPPLPTSSVRPATRSRALPRRWSGSRSGSARRSETV